MRILHWWENFWPIASFGKTLDRYITWGCFRWKKNHTGAMIKVGAGDNSKCKILNFVCSLKPKLQCRLIIITLSNSLQVQKQLRQLDSVLCYFWLAFGLLRKDMLRLSRFKLLWVAYWQEENPSRCNNMPVHTSPYTDMIIEKTIRWPLIYLSQLTILLTVS